MPFALIIAVPLAALLLWALYAEQPPPEPAPAQRAAWAGMPTHAQVARGDFPRAVWGYDPDAVDAHLAHVADSMALLLDPDAADAPAAEGVAFVPAEFDAVDPDPDAVHQEPADPPTTDEESTTPVTGEQG